MEKIFRENFKGFKVKTPSGFQDFAGVSFMGIKEVRRLEFEHGIFIECTSDHKLFVNENEYKEADQIQEGDTVQSIQGKIKLIKNYLLPGTHPVYDLIEVENGHRFYANNVLSSNCEFLSDSDTLLDPIFLGRVQGIDPIAKAGQVRIYHPIDAASTYLVTLDPSLGTGNDYAAIQVFSLPGFIQVAEWQHNRTPIPGQVKILKDILTLIENTVKQKSPGQRPEIYWTIENNSIGEAANIVIQDTGEENFPGEYISEKKRTRGKRVRKGFSTTNRTKIDACIKLKTFVETDKMKLLSKPLISECKNFVSSGAGYAAKRGEHDDLISACLLQVRLADQIKNYDDQFEEYFNQAIEDTGRQPLPIVVLRH